MKYYHHIFCLCITYTLCNSISGQGENNICMVGNGVGLNFNYDPPQVFTHPTKFEWETAASISDKSGQLLFYTDNWTVWNSNYKIITNGEGLKGGRSAFKGALFIPDIADTNKIYVFNLEDAKYNDEPDYGALYYSIIDKTIDQNKGGIIPTAKNIFVETGFGEGIHAIKGKCGTIWLLLFKRYSDEIYAYPFTQNGLGQPVVSKVIQSPAMLTSNKREWDWGNIYASMHYSYQLDKLILSTIAGVIEMYDMNLSTGRISNPLVIEQRTLYDLEVFRLYASYLSTILSKCGRYLFAIENQDRFSQRKNIVMYDLMSGDTSLIKASKKVIGSYRTTSPDSDDMYRHPISGDIYIAILSGEPYNYYLGVIKQDSTKGYSVRDSAVRVPEYFWRGMNMTNEVVVGERAPEQGKLLPLDTTLCLGDHITIDLSAYSGHDWSDGSREAIRRIDSAGTYMVRIETDQGCLIQDSIKISYIDEGDILRDTIICSGGELLLRLPEGLVGMWDDGSMSDRYMVTSSGAYSVSYISSAGCLIEDTAMVSIVTPIDVDLGSDIILCPGETVALRPEGSYSRYQWNTGSEDSLIGVSAAGEYILSVYDSMGCEARDTVMAVLASDCNCEVYIPNAISLDSSLGNDTFRAVSNCTLSDYQMDIYDRWGGLLYRSLSPEYAWDGTTSGQQVNSGVYLYRLSYRYPDAPQAEYRTGSIMVYR